MVQSTRKGKVSDLKKALHIVKERPHTAHSLIPLIRKDPETAKQFADWISYHARMNTLDSFDNTHLKLGLLSVMTLYRQGKISKEEAEKVAEKVLTTLYKKMYGTIPSKEDSQDEFPHYIEVKGPYNEETVWEAEDRAVLRRFIELYRTINPEHKRDYISSLEEIEEFLNNKKNFDRFVEYIKRDRYISDPEEARAYAKYIWEEAKRLFQSVKQLAGKNEAIKKLYLKKVPKQAIEWITTAERSEGDSLYSPYSDTLEKLSKYFNTSDHTMYEINAHKHTLRGKNKESIGHVLVSSKWEGIDRVLYVGHPSLKESAKQRRYIINKVREAIKNTLKEGHDRVYIEESLYD